MNTFLEKNIQENQKSEGVWPSVFLGHGSPMNAISDNEFTRFLSQLSKSIKTPQTILVASAHWETQGTKVQSLSQPETIHDFYGFPEKLYQVQYPAPGSKTWAQKMSKNPNFLLSQEWGLDHGTWSVLRHAYPEAKTPVFQLSLNKNLNLQQHFELAKELKEYRKQGLLILGSGNLTHNLGQWDRDTDAPAIDWALEFDEKVKKALLEQDLDFLLGKKDQKLWAQNHPTLDHYIPLLYVLGSAWEDYQSMDFLYEGIQNASISMRSLQML